jgi:type II secretory pathway component PulF
VGDHYDAEVTNAVQRLTSLLGPVILVVMGGVAGFIVISMMMAVFSMNSIDF